MIRLNLANITDVAVKEAFEVLLQQLNSTELLRGEWDFIEYTFTTSGVPCMINHRLKFTPIDIIEIHRDAGLSLTFDKTKFTQTTVYVTPAGIGTARFLVGKHNRGV